MMDYPELLFFDTFSHGSAQELNLDLVQFTNPVFVTEIRVIPLGARVQADFPGGVRLGATNPSEFSIEFFVNDLSTPGASTFQNIGVLEYNQNGPIHLTCQNKEIPTDGLILRGWYTTVTLAVYGFITKTRPPPSNLVAQNPPPTAETPSPRVISEHKTAEWIQQHAQVYHKEPVPYDVKDLPFEEDTKPTWLTENNKKPLLKTVIVEPDSFCNNDVKPIINKEQKSLQKSSEPLKRHSSTEIISDQEEDFFDDKSIEEEKPNVIDNILPRCSRSSSKNRIRCSRSHSRSNSQRHSSSRSRRHSHSHSRRHSHSNLRRRSHSHLRKRSHSHSRRRSHSRSRKRSYPRSNSQSRRRSHSRSKSKSSSGSKKRVQQQYESGELKLEPIKIEQREKTPESKDFLEVEPKLEPVTIVRSTIEPLPLAPEDVEMVSEEEISEIEDVFSPTASCLQVVDEIINMPNETLTPSAHEDSLDMDQFEPILSGSSDIESDDDMDIQDVEFDPSDLMDDPNKLFDPVSFEMQPLTCIRSPFITDYEWELEKLKSIDQSPPVLFTEKACRLEAYLANLESKSFEDSPDDWVTTIENIAPILITGLLYSDNKNDVIIKLTQLVNVGLSFDKAYHQPKPVFKVRHLKAGIQLVDTLCRCGEIVTIQLIKNANIQHKLLDLYGKEHVALSVKLAILRALDVSLNYGRSVKHFVNGEKNDNGYYRLVKIFCTSRTARIRYSLVNLLRKIHLFEALENLYAALIIEENYDDKSTKVEQNVEHLVMYLEETLRYLREAARLICQPVRFLPICSRFEFPRNTRDVYFTVYSYFNHFHLVDLLLHALMTPRYASNTAILSSVLEILAELSSSKDGLAYLASEVTVTNRITKLLLLNPEEQFSISPQLGLHITHRLYVLSLIDKFQLKWHSEQSGADIDNTQLLDTLSSLFYLTFTGCGRQAVMHVLSCGDLIKPLLKALQYSHNTGREKRKSPGKAYIVDLVWMIVRGSDNVPFLERHRADLIDIASWQSDPACTSWLNPVRNEFFASYNGVAELCDYLKKHTEKVVSFPGELITALRVLQYLAIPESRRWREDDDDETVELSYHYVLIQLFAQEGLTFMTSMLNKVCNHYERPRLYAYALAGHEGDTLMSFLLPVLKLIRALLDYVIQCRGVEFKDLTAIPVLLRTYSLLYAIPPSTSPHSNAIEAGHEIIDAFLAYTQTAAIESLSDSRSLDKSLWTSMMREVLKYVISLPEAFVPALSLLSELLPLPLPIQTCRPLTETEVSLVTNARKLWSAHMLPLDVELTNMIATLSCCSQSTLSQILKRVCIQIADLGPPSALVVARSILQGLWVELQICERLLTPKCARLLNVFACLLTHAPLKATVVQITGNTDEAYSDLWPTLFRYLSQPFEGNALHAQAQEFIVSSIQSLCDINISLWPAPETPNVSVESYLSNSLPPKQLFRSAIETLIKLAENAAENAFTTLSAVIRAFVTLFEYNNGIHRLKSGLGERPSLYNITLKIADEWNRENTDCVNCLTSILGFLKECLSVPVELETNLRTLPVSATELTTWLKWNNENDAKHPLKRIETILEECATGEEELFVSLGSNVSDLIDSLNAARPIDSDVDPSIEMILELPESLLTQFQYRQVYVVGEVEDERLSATFWLSVAPVEDLEQEAEQIYYNLEEIVATYLSTQQVEAELEKLGHRDVAKLDLTPIKANGNEQSNENEVKPSPTVLVRPAKTRTFIRPPTGAHRNDAFRSRIPNSSRAPSLHVDDFIALEKHNQQQAASAAYNRLAGKHQLQDPIALRNRNHLFLQDRGNHFHSPFHPRGVMNSWHPMITAERARNVTKTQQSVIRHSSATPLIIRGSDLMRYGLSLRWPSSTLRPTPSQIHHHPPQHTSLHRHLRPPPSGF